MVKLRRHLSAVISLLDLIRKRENTKRENVQITASILEKRFIVRDFSGHILAEAAAARYRFVQHLKLWITLINCEN